MRWCVVLPLLAACGGAGGVASWEGRVDTTPGGWVRVTNPARGLWGDEPAWRLVPAFVIGEGEGTDATLFSVIAGLEVDDAGRIYVLDREDNEIRIFGPDGALVRAVGRSGGGPGEYRNANGLRWMADTLVVVDQRGARYTVLTRDGEYVRVVPRRLGFYGWVFSGGTAQGRIYERAYLDSGEAFVATDLGGGDTVSQDLDTIPLPVLAGAPPYEGFSVRTERGGMFIGVPFAAGNTYHLDQAGGLWHGHGSAFRLFHSSLAGDTLLEISLAIQPAPVTAEELADWEADDGVTRFREMGGKIDRGRIPTVKPFFERLQVDPEGNLWVSFRGRGTEAGFRLFDSAGRYLGAIRLDGPVPDAGVPPVVRNGRLHLVGRDSLDVQRVYVFTIEK